MCPRIQFWFLSLYGIHFAFEMPLWPYFSLQHAVSFREVLDVYDFDWRNQGKSICRALTPEFNIQ